MSGYIITIIVLLMGSAFFSASETAYTSVNLIRLKNQAEQGDRKAARALKLAEDYDNLLSGILIGNNVVNIGAASIATVLFVSLIGDDGVAVSTFVLTLLTLIFGENIPKIVAKEYPEAFAKAFSRPLASMLFICRPLTWFFRQLKTLIFKVIGRKKDKGITEKELLTIVDVVESGGNIEAHEGELIRSAIEFDDLKAREIYTPRVKVTGVEITDTEEDIAKVFAESGYSRLPVYEDNLDNIIGILHLKDFYNANLIENFKIEEVMQSPLFITLNMKISRLMGTLKRNQSHMAVVRDEYGGTVGIVTLEDILEELVGDIWDEHDEVESELIEIDKNVYLVPGEAEIDKVLPELGVSEKEIDEMDANIISGWVMDSLGHIPVENEVFQYKNLKVTVEEVTRTHVVTVKIERQMPLKEKKENLCD